MGEGWQSPLLFPEAIAQAALLLEGGDAEAGRSGFLAGIQGFRSSAAAASRARRSRSRSGSPAASAPCFRFDGEVRSGEELLARGSVLVRQGESAPQEAQEGTS